MTVKGQQEGDLCGNEIDLYLFLKNFYKSLSETDDVRKQDLRCSLDLYLDCGHGCMNLHV